MNTSFLTRVALAAKALRGGTEQVTPKASDFADVRAYKSSTVVRPYVKNLTYTAQPSMAASDLQPVALPEAKKGQTSLPSFRTQTERSDDLLAKTNRVTANTDATTFRSGTDKSTVIRNFLAANPDMAATVNAYLRVGIPDEFTVTGHDMDGRLNPDATRLAHQILTRLTYVGDPTMGYNPTTDVQSMSETLGRELLLEGAAMIELVLDDLLQPLYPAPIAVSKVSFREDKTKGVYPVQVIGGDEIELDLATVFYVSVDQDLLTPYAVAYLDTAVRAVLADEGFSNFLQRQLKRNIAPRMMAKIIEKNVRSSVGPEILSDDGKLRTYLTGLIQSVQQQLEELEPEDALISTDAIEYEMKAPGGSGAGVGDMLQKFHSIIEGRMTAALKSLPAVLGRDTSSGSATTSTYLFMKSAGVIRTKLNTLYSRLLTQAVRLMSLDCYVKFEYDNLDLRPKGEQEAYKAMEQSRTLELLSIGFLTDEEACVRLTRRMPPEGYTNKSGTMFKVSSAKIQDTTSQTSLMNGQKDNLKSDTPTSKKGG